MKKSIAILLAAPLLLASCSDFLELNESEYHTVKYQFSTFSRVKQSATNVYGYVRDGLADVEETMLDAATDDAVYVWETNNIKRFYDGSWSPVNLIDDRWDELYAAIAAANYFLENCPEDFPEAKYQDNYAEDLKQLKNYPFEIRALRAYFHFELLKRYRSIVIANRSFTKEEVNTLEPATYDRTVEWIVDECDAIIPSLPVTYSGSYYGEVGRVTRGMAQALKARVLLYAASPLNNPTGDRTRYLRAAAAAKEIIDSGVYSLIDEQTTNNASAKGLIFGKLCPLSSTFEAANFPIGYEGGNTGICPSQNLAEAFDMRNGTVFNRNDEGHWRNLLNASMRDPRFAKTLLYNGALFKDQYIQSYTGGRNGLPLDGASVTSYYLYKHIQEETSFVAGSETYFQHVYPLFRYAEVVLNYAEALGAATQNAAFTGTLDVDGVDVAFDLSPLEALNQVRTRYGMPAIASVVNYDSFETRLRNERRVELAFEGHRFWDIRRWKIGPQTTRLYGLEITNANGSISYTRKLVQERIWDDKMYYYPLSEAELYNNRNLIQNEGWN
ncbi:RagB/SusD family nutrient uptake outer membrane protein [uncultured Alistipes sp.]|uniref:RagB/SusD family nutrient uptake outer membrane protein n=1 Tax=uncultured Alistipes sp. TaxID=538949 RepID=UPI00320B37AD